jgi:hypothetical protein
MKNSVLVVDCPDTDIDQDLRDQHDIIAVEYAFKRNKDAQYLVWSRPAFWVRHACDMWKVKGEIVRLEHGGDHCADLSQQEYELLGLQERIIMFARSKGYTEINFMSEAASVTSDDQEPEAIANPEEI